MITFIQKNNSKFHNKCEYIVSTKSEYYNLLKQNSSKFSDFLHFDVFDLYFGEKIEKELLTDKIWPLHKLERGYTNYQISKRISQSVYPGSKFYYYIRGYSYEYNLANNKNLYKFHTPSYWGTKGYTKNRSRDMAKQCYTENITSIPGPKSCLTTEFWLHRGYTLEEASSKISKLQRDNAAVYYNGTTKEERKYNNNTCVEYYVKRGATVEEAKNKIKKRQITFSLDKCIESFGPELGKQKWKVRQEKWQNTLNKRTQEQKLAVKHKQDCVSLEWARRNTINEEEAILLHQRECIKRMVRVGKASKESILVFKPILDYFGTKYPDIKYYMGIENNTEFFLSSPTEVYFYDFTVPSIKLIIEYNGCAFHPRKGQTDWVGAYGQSYESALLHDKNKEECAHKGGYDIFTIWSDESPVNIIDEIKRFIDEKSINLIGQS